MRLHRALAAVAALTLAATVALVPTLPAGATTTSVANEAQYCAALAALSGDGSGPHTITLTADVVLDDGTDPTYTGSQPLTLDGDGHSIDANDTSRILASTSLGGITVREVAVRDGNTSSNLGGGGVYSQLGLRVIDSTFTGNQVPMGGGVAAHMTAITGSVFRDNEATSGGGGAQGTQSVTVDTSSFVTTSPAATAVESPAATSGSPTAPSPATAPAAGRAAGSTPASRCASSTPPSRSTRRRAGAPTSALAPASPSTPSPRCWR